MTWPIYFKWKFPHYVSENNVFVVTIASSRGQWVNGNKINDIWNLTCCYSYCQALSKTLHWRHNGRECVSNHQPYDCLFNRLFRRRSKKTSKLGVTGLCEGNSPGTGEFPTQMASNAQNVSIWWRHHDYQELWYQLVKHKWNIIPML